jgi:hypothetical protein
VRGPCILAIVAVPKKFSRHGTPEGVDRPAGLRSEEAVLGAYLSESPGVMHGAHKFFGTDDTFVFGFPPAADKEHAAQPRCGMRTHRWVEGSNKEFLLSSPYCVGVGGGKDGAAIYLGTDLQYGTTSLHCETFQCGPLVAGDTQGLQHVEFAVHRLWLFALSTDFEVMTAIPPSLLTSHSASTLSLEHAESHSQNSVERVAAASLGRSPMLPDGPLGDSCLFTADGYRTRYCCAAGHHRCRFIGEALHLHGARARHGHGGHSSAENSFR